MEQTLFVPPGDAVELRVSGVTNPKELAGSIAHNVNEGRSVKLSAIGHQAIGQAIKAVPIANSYVVAHGFVLVILPSFEVKKISPTDGGADMLERTACMLHLVRLTPK